MATLRMALCSGGPISNIDMPIAAVGVAILTLKHQRVIGRCATRNRRPALDELDRLLTYFLERYLADLRRVPMHQVIGGATSDIRARAKLVSMKDTSVKLAVRSVSVPFFEMD